MTVSNEVNPAGERKMTNVFERYLTVWVALCIAGGIVLGKVAPGVSKYLDGLSIFVNGAPVVSIPIAICLFFMMYPIMVKICLRTQHWFPGKGVTLSAGRTAVDLLIEDRAGR